MTSLSTGIDAASLVAGFAFGAVCTVTAWAALFGIALLRRMLSDSSEI